MRCAACQKSYAPGQDKRTCTEAGCPAGGKGRLIDIASECDQCKKLGTVEPVRVWTTEHWMAGKHCDDFESWRALVVKRVPNKDRPNPPSTKHIHAQDLKSEEMLTGGRK